MRKTRSVETFMALSSMSGQKPAEPRSACAGSLDVREETQAGRRG
jgi:hypothetical protein